jgi:rsbT co-antagonist protein RsbR
MNKSKNELIDELTVVEAKYQALLSEKQQVERHLEQMVTDRTGEMQKFKALIEGSRDFIGYLDIGANASVYVNSAGAKMMGYDAAAEVMGRPLDFFHPAEDLAYMDENVVPVVMEGGFWRGESRLLRRDESPIPVDQVLFLIHDEQEDRYLLSTIMTDISERKQAELERDQLQQEVIEAQQRSIQELSTPVIPIMDRIIVMPMVGNIDSMRARDITRSLLAGIGQHRAKVVILDVTGVSLMDTGIVNHLNKTIQAARLKGARTIVTGISDAVAESIVDLGIDWSEITTLSDLQTGLVIALEGLGLRIERD